MARRVHALGEELHEKKRDSIISAKDIKEEEDPLALEHKNENNDKE